jgi:hypothetical protein
MIISPKENLSFCLKGPKLDEGPMPLIYYFALSGLESLEKDPINQITTSLEGKRVRFCSLDLPFHNGTLSPSDALASWASVIEQKIDLFSSFNEKVLESLSWLSSRGAVQSQIGIAGLSRGALAALQLTAIEPKFKAITLFAPLLFPSQHPTFANVIDETLRFDCTNYLNQIVDRPLHIYVGNKDTLVKTSNAFTFFNKLTNLSKLASPPQQLTITRSIGRWGHGTMKEVFYSGGAWLYDELMQIKSGV